MGFYDFLVNFWNGLVQSLVGQNTFQDYTLFLAVFVGIFLLLLVIDKYILGILGKGARKTKTHWDDYVIGFLSNIGWLFFGFISFYAAAQILTLNDLVMKVLNFFLIIAIGYYTGKGVNGIVNRLVNRKVSEKREKNNIQNISMVKVLGVFAKIGVWVLIMLMVLSNLGVEITPLIAGLGVGGIAIALAAQAVLSDLFSAFVIYFDKPFTEGDFIIVGDDMGVVKDIGIKTTRITTLQGQELVVANSILTSSRINNYKKMEKRRVGFGFGVTYDTPASKLRKIKKIVADAVDKANTHFKKKKNKIDLNRVHFKAFGQSSLDFEVVFYVPSGDYNEFMDIQEFINLHLVESFEKEKIEFAFPTRTLYMHK